uniref:Uncharacterized protein n=1 Tax=Ciona intestinalis TaxID=7719 RepID=H2Y096_CIOIN
NFSIEPKICVRNIKNRCFSFGDEWHTKKDRKLILGICITPGRK